MLYALTFQCPFTDDYVVIAALLVEQIRLQLSVSDRGDCSLSEE